MLGRGACFSLIAGWFFCCLSPSVLAEVVPGFDGATSPEALASSLEAEAEATAASAVGEDAPPPEKPITQPVTPLPAMESKAVAMPETVVPPEPTAPFVGLWQSQRPAPPMWLDIKPNGQAYRCYVETAEGDSDIYASNGTLETDRIAWKILWGKERVTVSGEAIILQGKTGSVFYAKTKDPLPPACDGTDQAGTVERNTRSFNR